MSRSKGNKTYQTLVVIVPISLLMVTYWLVPVTTQLQIVAWFGYAIGNALQIGITTIIILGIYLLIKNRW